MAGFITIYSNASGSRYCAQTAQVQEQSPGCRSCAQTAGAAKQKALNSANTEKGDLEQQVQCAL